MRALAVLLHLLLHLFNEFERLFAQFRTWLEDGARTQKHLCLDEVVHVERVGVLEEYLSRVRLELSAYVSLGVLVGALLPLGQHELHAFEIARFVTSQ